MRIQVSENFYLDEFLHPHIYSRLAGTDFVRNYIRREVIEGAQLFRDLVGAPVTINNWWRGGRFKNRGTRLPSWRGSNLSPHKFGAACDLSVKGMTSHQMLELVMDNEYDFIMNGIRRIEHPDHTIGRGEGWLHMDCFEPKGLPVDRIKIFDP